MITTRDAITTPECLRAPIQTIALLTVWGIVSACVDCNVTPTEGSGTPLGPREPEAGVRALLKDLQEWDSATDDERLAAAHAVERRVPGISFSRMEKFSCGSQTHSIAVFLHRQLGLELSLIPGGTSQMGSPIDEPGRFSDELQHRVTLTHPFLVSRHVITQAAYERIAGKREFPVPGADFPATGLSWYVAKGLCERIGLRLPTEAEWEYACRGGATTAWYFGDDEELLSEYADYPSISASNIAQPVGRKRPNAFGVFGMHGGVREWCADWYGDYPRSEATDPSGPARGVRRVIRGGDWDVPHGTRCARRGSSPPEESPQDAGVRPVLPIGVTAR